MSKCIHFAKLILFLTCNILRNFLASSSVGVGSFPSSHSCVPTAVEGLAGRGRRELAVTCNLCWPLGAGHLSLVLTLCRPTADQKIRRWGRRLLMKGGMVGRYVKKGGREGGGHELVRPVRFVKEEKLKKCGIFWSPLPATIPVLHHMTAPPPRTSPCTNQPIMLYYLAQHARELLYSALWTTFSVSKR